MSSDIWKLLRSPRFKLRRQYIHNNTNKISKVHTMFKKFAAALIASAVFADSGNMAEQGIPDDLNRGDGSGNSQDNAFFQNLLANG